MFMLMFGLIGLFIDLAICLFVGIVRIAVYCSPLLALVYLLRRERSY